MVRTKAGVEKDELIVSVGKSFTNKDNVECVYGYTGKPSMPKRDQPKRDMKYGTPEEPPEQPKPEEPIEPIKEYVEEDFEGGKPKRPERCPKCQVTLSEDECWNCGETV